MLAPRAIGLLYTLKNHFRAGEQETSSKAATPLIPGDDDDDLMSFN